eukprot:CAMPEP_0195049442 /NCGR_PEP_ID=MMETSP0347-20130606/57130_1 /TAXON_ID=2932 /ORGANISM="Alexandrium fundyense, Strain CCMP1719" /LENGTH=61 /DNA_ID=CAMNT_0040078177 /DNA_START=1 /DNA_END=183 /DNA_ORIENTATION=-
MSVLRQRCKTDMQQQETLELHRQPNQRSAAQAGKGLLPERQHQTILAALHPSDCATFQRRC